MTLPDDLVKVVAAAPHNLLEIVTTGVLRPVGVVDAEAIVAALLRALPESEAVQAPFHYPFEKGWNDCLAAIAKLAGDE